MSKSLIRLKEDDVVLCRVKKIEGTTVFLDIEDSPVQGHMVLSEVAAGRIRNLRQYVSVNRRVVCKVLKVAADHVELSLRRVTAKERDDIMERYKKERAFATVLKVVGESPEKVLAAIKEEYDIGEFLLLINEDERVLESFMSAERARKVVDILKEKVERGKDVERIFTLQSDSESGVKEIRDILTVEGADIHYLGSGRFSIRVTGKDFKEANMKLNEILSQIEKRAKDKKALLEVKKEK